MTALQDLRLWYCTSLTDLSPLAALKNLSLLEITHAMSLADITPLAELNKLDALDLRGCAIADLTPIARLANLEWLVLSYSPSISDSEFRSFLLSVPSVYIYLSSSELANVPTELRNGENVYFMVSGADLPADSGG
jgi:Leucine-rich repeat (LRR) protein